MSRNAWTSEGIADAINRMIEDRNKGKEPYDNGSGSSYQGKTANQSPAPTYQSSTDSR